MLPETSSFCFRLRVLLLSLFALHTARAEYQSVYINFMAVTVQGDSLSGYITLPTEYLNEDSLESQSYLRRVFDGADHKRADTLIYAKHLIAYRYVGMYSEDTSVAYVLLGTGSLLRSSIVHLQIKSHFSYTYLTGVHNINTIGDTAWACKPPVLREAVSGYLCDWTILVHTRSAKTDAVIAKLKKAEASMRKLEEDYASLRNQGVSAAQEEVENALNEREEKIDEELSNLLDEFEGEKVVIVSFCSC